VSTGTRTVHIWTGSSVGYLTSYWIKACPKAVSRLFMKYFLDIYYNFRVTKFHISNHNNKNLIIYIPKTNVYLKVYRIL